MVLIPLVVRDNHVVTIKGKINCANPTPVAHTSGNGRGYHTVSEVQKPYVSAILRHIQQMRIFGIKLKPGGVTKSSTIPKWAVFGFVVTTILR